MSKYKARLKDFIYQTGTAHLLDKLMFSLSWLKNKRRNARYRKDNKNVAIPSDYYLYETYLLNFEQYINDGKVTAQEIVEWTNRYLTANPEKVLEWGCGVSRIVRHLHKFYARSTSIYGCDINTGMIAWNEQHIKDVAYEVVGFEPPTGYSSEQFDMVYAISVFTHIIVNEQEAWLQEMHRILKPQGIFLFTTHGYNYFNNLVHHERKELELKGSVSKSYYKKGHRMMSSYNMPDAMARCVEKYFDILEFWDGREHLSKMGGQDLWIVRKKT